VRNATFPDAMKALMFAIVPVNVSVGNPEPAARGREEGSRRD
jgi:hypothetical protein